MSNRRLDTRTFGTLLVLAAGLALAIPAQAQEEAKPAAAPAAQPEKPRVLDGPPAALAFKNETVDRIVPFITEVTGKRTTYVEETLEEAYESRASYNAPAWELDAWVSTYTAIAQGELALITGTVEDLVGRPALTLREFLTAETA